MKTRILPIIVGCGVLLPIAQLQAADPVGTVYGGFLPGKKFTLVVTERTSTTTKGTTVTKNVPIPDGLPNFSKGDKVRFKIGSNGQLTTTSSDFSITYRKEVGLVNFYSNRPTFRYPNGNSATVTKNSSDKPLAATLTFYKFRFSGFIPVTYTVNYVLEQPVYATNINPAH